MACDFGDGYTNRSIEEANYYKALYAVTAITGEIDRQLSWNLQKPTVNFLEKVSPLINKLPELEEKRLKEEEAWNKAKEALLPPKAEPSKEELAKKRLKDLTGQLSKALEVPCNLDRISALSQEIANENLKFTKGS